ncbi:MAG: BglII/BstYI family type II restriction endonuclease [Verrucomicrobiota bacterium]|nr:BglII/BstYI family type II restriction endonuclease [Verrucomicrobiota bacterium]
MALSDFPKTILSHYAVHEWRHASAVLKNDFPNEWNDILEVLGNFRLCKSHISVGGGGKSKVSASIDAAFNRRGWKEKSFKTQIRVDDREIDSPTHKVDCFKNGIGVEIEWNNKTEFYDRDLNNFRLLFQLRALNVGVIITRCDELQTIFDKLGRGSSYGFSTTILSKLLRKLEGGSGGGCPVLVFGITHALYDENS